MPRDQCPPGRIGRFFVSFPLPVNTYGLLFQSNESVILEALNLPHAFFSPYLRHCLQASLARREAGREEKRLESSSLQVDRPSAQQSSLAPPVREETREQKRRESPQISSQEMTFPLVRYMQWTISHLTPTYTHILRPSPFLTRILYKVRSFMIDRAQMFSVNKKTFYKQINLHMHNNRGTLMHLRTHICIVRPGRMVHMRQHVI